MQLVLVVVFLEDLEGACDAGVVVDGVFLCLLERVQQGHLPLPTAPHGVRVGDV